MGETKAIEILQFISSTLGFCEATDHKIKIFLRGLLTIKSPVSGQDRDHFNWFVIRNARVKVKYCARHVCGNEAGLCTEMLFNTRGM